MAARDVAFPALVVGVAFEDFDHSGSFGFVGKFPNLDTQLREEFGEFVEGLESHREMGGCWWLK